MKVSQIVFSPTGGTGRVAEVITQAWGGPVTKIDLSNTETDYSSLRLEKEDIAIIAVPSYGGRVPSLAAQRISNIYGNHTLLLQPANGPFYGCAQLVRLPLLRCAPGYTRSGTQIHGRV